MLRAVITCVCVSLLNGAPRSDDPASDAARVDVQVFTAQELPIKGLQASDFAVYCDDKAQPLKAFSAETMPVDVLFLLDVSQPMKPYIQFLRDNSEAALAHSFTEKDRMAVMTFDVNIKPVLPFTSNRGDVTDAIGRVVHSEQFNGGARITTALISAASYLQRHARPEARRAIVVLTGNSTQDGEDEQRVLAALQRAGATLSFLFPFERKDVDEDGDPAIPSKEKKHRQPSPQLKHAPPESAPHEAGTGLVAQDSGGDAVVFEDEYALTETLRHIGQRYTLLFAGAPPEKLVADLTSESRARFPTAVVHFRLLYHAGRGTVELMVPMNLTPEEQKKHPKAVNEEPN